MEKNDKTRELLISHFKKYPQMQIQDIFKFIYQSSFGCEHMVTSPDGAEDYILEEYRSTKSGEVLVDILDGDYSRVHLEYINRGLSVKTLGRLFFKSAQKEPDGTFNLVNKLNTARELVKEKVLPFSEAQFDKEAEKWQNIGYPAIHHSDAFRREYHPAYRVIANKYVTFLPVFAGIDALSKNGIKVVAIEGGSASGKTTLSTMLKDIYNCTVIHMDDFFLRPEQRTAERYAQVGGNIDRERFLEEVLVPLSENKAISYRKFDCATMTLSKPEIITPEKLVIVEGAYSMHPEFSGFYDLSVFLDIGEDLQKSRIAKRNEPQMAERFLNEWIPLEQLYFSKLNIKESCHITIKI